MNSFRHPDSFVSLFKSVPIQKRDKLLQVLVTTYQLGLRSLILKELKPIHLIEFENTFIQTGNLGLLDFGQKYVPDFEEKYNQMLAKITDRLIQTM